jgi:hypothetical protein
MLVLTHPLSHNSAVLNLPVIIVARVISQKKADGKN